MSAREPLLWRMLARVACSWPIRSWLIQRAARNPYRHLPGYMERGWVFNPYPGGSGSDAYRARISWFPSIRVHYIQAPDWTAASHNHPWRARTIVLKGWYCERRVGRSPHSLLWSRGSTYALERWDFHNIYAVWGGGATTLFITFPRRRSEPEQQDWGFLGPEGYVPHGQWHEPGPTSRPQLETRDATE